MNEHTSTIDDDGADDPQPSPALAAALLWLRLDFVSELLSMAAEADEIIKFAREAAQ